MFLVLGYIQAQAYGIIGEDGYYHIRWSRLLWEGFSRGELPRFTWLPLTILDSSRYVDHHFLFHVMQIPFTWFGDLVAGAKISAVVFGAAAVFACYGLIRVSGARWPLVWLAAILASSSHFLFRMSTPRAMSVTIVSLALATWLLFTRRYVWVGILAFPLVWAYSLFPLLLVLCAAWTFADALETGAIDWRPVTFAAAGIVLGLVINPYFPQNLILLVEHARMKVATDSAVLVGAEWYPLSSWGLVTTSMATVAAQVAGWLCVRPEQREGSARPVALLVFSTFLALLAFKSRRFMEYWPPFAVVFCAFAARPWIDRLVSRTRESARWRRASAVAAASVTAVVLFLLVSAVRQAITIDTPVEDTRTYVGASRWLTENTDESSLVFNADWDDFPALFYENTHNAYVSGLDPTYLLYADPDRASEYDRIVAGDRQDPGPAIRSTFGARFAISAKDAEHEAFLRRARADRSMRVAFEDDLAVVFEVVE